MSEYCSIITSEMSFNCQLMNGMHHAKKLWDQESPFSNTIKDTSTIMRNPLPENNYVGRG